MIKTRTKVNLYIAVLAAAVFLPCPLLAQQKADSNRTTQRVPPITTSLGSSAAPAVPLVPSSPEPSVTDWIQAVSAAVAAVVAIILLWQLSLLKKQLQLTKDQISSGVQWNKLNAAFTYFNSDVVIQRERAMVRALRRVNIDFHNLHRPLTPDELDEIEANDEVFADIKDFLNLVEDYSTAVRVGAIDADAGFAMMSGLMQTYYTVFGPFIDEQRVRVNDSEAFCEIEKLSKEWGIREDGHRQERERHMEESRERIEASRGIQRKV